MQSGIDQILVFNHTITDRFTLWGKVFFGVLAEPQSNDVGLSELNFVNKVHE